MAVNATIQIDTPVTSTQTNVATPTWNHTLGPVGSGSNRVAFVILAAEDGAINANVFTSVSFGGVAMSFITGSVDNDAGDDERVELWALRIPGNMADGVKAITTVLGVTADVFMGCSFVVNNVDGTVISNSLSAVATSGTDTNGGMSVSGNVRDFCIAAIIKDTDNAVSDGSVVGGPMFNICNVVSGSGVTLTASYAYASIGAVGFNWTWTGSNDFAVCGQGIKPRRRRTGAT